MLSAAKIEEVLDRARASEVSRIGGNSTITHVVIGSQEYAVKDYSARLDGDPRLATEPTSSPRSANRGYLTYGPCNR